MADAVLSSLLRINRQRLRQLRSELLPYRYVGVMHLIVLYIRRQPGASQEEIACFYALDRTSVARDARRLEDMGHIRREIDPINRRQYQVYLTEAGEAMGPVIDAAYDAFVRRISTGIPPEDWQALTRLLEKLEQNSAQDRENRC